MGDFILIFEKICLPSIYCIHVLYCLSLTKLNSVIGNDTCYKEYFSLSIATTTQKQECFIWFFKAKELTAEKLNFQMNFVRDVKCPVAPLKWYSSARCAGH